MTFTRLLALAGVAVLVLFANVAASVLYMVVYSHAIDPGHEVKYYEEHIQVAAPYCSIVAGVPLMFLAGWIVASWWNGRPGKMAAIYVWLIYTLIDLAILLSVGMTSPIFVLFILSFATKLAAGYAGAWTRIRRQRNLSC